MLDNEERDGGGYESLRDPDRVLPVWLDRAGYDTALVGKWLHDYRTFKPAPGWDRFFAITAPTMVDYYGYDVTDSKGGRTHYGKKASDYVTDVLTRDYALPYIRAHAHDHDPFFLHVSYIAPHWGRGRNDPAGRQCSNGKPFAFQTAKAKPAPRDAGAFSNRKLPTPPSFNEPTSATSRSGARPRAAAPARDPRPHPEVPLRARQPAGGRPRGQADRRGARRRAPDPQHVRDLHVGQRLHARRAPDRARRRSSPTRRRSGCRFVIRGPGIPAGERITDPVANVDLAPTILDLAEVQVAEQDARPIDGRSLAPYTYGRGDPQRAILIESKHAPRRVPSGSFASPSWSGVRTRHYVYIEYYRAEVGSLDQGFGLPIGSGSLTDTELYDLERDPHELQNRASDIAYAQTKAALAEALAGLRSCSGADCDLDVTPPPPTGIP